MGIPVHERSLKSGEVKACMLSGLYVMIMLVDKSKLGDPWPWSAEHCPALYGAKPSYTGAVPSSLVGHQDGGICAITDTSCHSHGAHVVVEWRLSRRSARNPRLTQAYPAGLASCPALCLRMWPRVCAYRQSNVVLCTGQSGSSQFDEGQFMRWRKYGQ